MQTRRGLITGLAVLAGGHSEAQERITIYFRWNSAVLLPNMQKRVAAVAQ